MNAGPERPAKEYRCRAERFFTAQDGTRIHAVEWGGATDRSIPAILCLPGLSRSGRDFDDMAERLACRYRILCVDYRGRSRSETCSDWRRYHPRVLLDDVRHLMAAFGLHRMIAIGTSLGGALAMSLGVLAPAALAGVVLNDIGLSMPSTAAASRLAFVGRDHPQPDWSAAIAYLRDRFPHLPAYGPGGWRRIAERTFREGPDGTLHVDWDPAIVKPFVRPDRDDANLGRLFRSLAPIPVMVVRGALSDVLDEAGLAEMRLIRADLVHATVPGVGHAPSLDEPLLREPLDAFLDRLA